MLDAIAHREVQTPGNVLVVLVEAASMNRSVAGLRWSDEQLVLWCRTGHEMTAANIRYGSHGQPECGECWRAARQRIITARIAQVEEGQR
jgi:hypothetical protein